MLFFRVFLITFTVLIFAISWAALSEFGTNWPRVYFGDLAQLNWRSQFNLDLGMHLVLVGFWVAWREGFRALGLVYATLCFLLGGMFTFPYIFMHTMVAGGDIRRVLLGRNAAKGAA